MSPVTYSTTAPRTRHGAQRRDRSGLSVLLALVVALFLAVAGLWAGVQVDGIVHHGSPRAIAVANATAPYAVLVAGFALLRRSPVRAALDAVVFFVSFIAGYYLDLAHQAGVSSLNRHYAGIWLLIAALICPVIAATLAWARRRRGILPAIVFAIPAAAALTEALTARTWGMGAALPGVVVGADLLVAAGYLIALPRGILTRVLVLLAMTPLTVALVTITDHLHQINAYSRLMY